MNRPKSFSGLYLTLALSVLGAVGACFPAADARAEESSRFVDLAAKPLPRLEPGIVIGNHAKSGYSDIVTLMLPRLASGHIDSLPDYSKRYASLFKCVILANVAEKKTGGPKEFVLDKIGIGFAMKLNGKMTVVTSSTANDYGANLGMIDRGVLSGNEDCLEDIVQIARTESLVMFDAKCNMLVGSKHEERYMRHVVWAEPSSGKLGMLVWLLKAADKGNHLVDSPEMQFVQPPFEEDRRIHVSEGGFFSSKIPTPDRFALVSLPQGTEVPFSKSLRTVAGDTSMTRAELERMLLGINESFELLSAGNSGSKK